MRGFAITLFPNNISPETTPEEINNHSLVIPVLANDEAEALTKVLNSKPDHTVLALISLDTINAYRNLILNLAKEKNVSLTRLEVRGFIDKELNKEDN